MSKQPWQGVDGALKALHFDIERLWRCYPALHRVQPDIHIVEGTNGAAGAGLPGYIALIVTVPNTPTGRVVIDHAMNNVLDTTQRVYGKIDAIIERVYT